MQECWLHSAVCGRDRPLVTLLTDPAHVGTSLARQPEIMVRGVDVNGLLPGMCALLEPHSPVSPGYNAG